MTLKTRFFSILTIALSVVVFSTFTMAQDGGTTEPAAEKAAKRATGERRFGKEGKAFGRRHGKRGGAMAGLRAVNLTDAQKEQMKTIRQANRPDQAAREEVRTLRKAKRDGTITEDQQARLTALRTESREKRVSVREQLLAILTPEQKTQIEQKRQEMKQRFEERRNMRRQKQSPAATDTPKAS